MIDTNFIKACQEHIDEMNKAVKNNSNANLFIGPEDDLHQFLTGPIVDWPSKNRYFLRDGHINELITEFNTAEELADLI